MDPLIVALQDAARAGFSVCIEYTKGQYEVDVVTRFTLVGQASERVKPFIVRRPDLTDALGNALAVVGVEIGIDRAAKAKRLEEA